MTPRHARALLPPVIPRRGPVPKTPVPQAGRSLTQNPDLLRRLLRAKDRMDGAPQEDWTIQRLAQVSAVSPSHFARSFKLAFGLPPHRYLLARRIERAVALLRDTDLPITEIAWQTGWKSLGTFGRIFRDITGRNPGSIRAHERATTDARRHIPECVARAAGRPDLNSAVSEKRRSECVAKMGLQPTERRQ